VSFALKLAIFTPPYPYLFESLFEWSIRGCGRARRVLGVWQGDSLAVGVKGLLRGLCGLPLDRRALGDWVRRAVRRGQAWRYW